MEGYDIFNIDYCYRVHSSWNLELEEDLKFREAVQQYEEQLKKVMEENNRQQQVIEEKIRKLQIIKDRFASNDNIQTIFIITLFLNSSFLCCYYGVAATGIL